MNVIRTCEVCGKQFEDPSRFKPSMYCSPDCRCYAKYKVALEKCALAIQPTPEARSILRGDLFRLSNLMGIGTNTN